MVFPFITRKKHEKEMSILRNMQSAYLETIRVEMEVQLEEEKKEIHEVIQGLINVAVVHDKNSVLHPWRLVLDLDARDITGALMRGNDNPIIEYIADGVRYQVICVLKSVNIQRPEDLNLKRRGGSYR